MNNFENLQPHRVITYQHHLMLQFISSFYVVARHIC